MIATDNPSLASLPETRRLLPALGDPLGFRAGDANLYRYTGNDPINAIDPVGLAGQKVGNYSVRGTGHHVIPVSLWQEFGFAEELYPFLDEYETIDAVTHNNLGHGTKTGYTAFLRAELRERLTSELSNNPKKRLSVIEQQAFLKTFIDDVHDGNVKRKFIVEFNKAAEKRGAKGVRDWLNSKEGRKKFPKYADEVAPVAIKGLRSISKSKASKLLGFLGDSTKFAGKKFLPLVGALVVYNEARANGNSPAEAAFIAGLEEINPLPVGYAEVQAAGQGYENLLERARQSNRDRMSRILDIEYGGDIPDNAGGR